MTIFNSFKHIRVLVFGDVMLDRFWWGTVDRISPEAPVPVVRMLRQSFSPGGAANVAANVAGLGAVPLLVGAVGSDAESIELSNVLRNRGIDLSHIVHFEERQTIVKTRIVAHNQQVVRVDRESSDGFTDEQEERVWNRLADVLPDADIVIVSDYAKNLVTTGIMSKLTAMTKKLGKMLLVDPKGRDFSKYSGSTLITPNRREAADACGLDLDSRGTIDAAGKQLLDNLNSQAVLITLSEDGMALFQPDCDPVRLPAAARGVYDVTGAGDTVIASMGVALGAGLGFTEAAKIANAAAGVVVGQFGTAAISVEQLDDAMMQPNLQG